MSAFDNAAQFFHACETARGWAGCKQYVAANASFTAQSIPLEGIDTVEAYCEWMANFGNNIVPGCSYDVHASAYDETNATAIFFATFSGRDVIGVTVEADIRFSRAANTKAGRNESRLLVAQGLVGARMRV